MKFAIILLIQGLALVQSSGRAVVSDAADERQHRRSLWRNSGSRSRGGGGGGGRWGWGKGGGNNYDDSSEEVHHESDERDYDHHEEEPCRRLTYGHRSSSSSSSSDGCKEEPPAATTKEQPRAATEKPPEAKPKMPCWRRDLTGSYSYSESSDGEGCEEPPAKPMPCWRRGLTYGHDYDSYDHSDSYEDHYDSYDDHHSESISYDHPEESISYDHYESSEEEGCPPETTTKPPPTTTTTTPPPETTTTMLLPSPRNDCVGFDPDTCLISGDPNALGDEYACVPKFPDVCGDCPWKVELVDKKTYYDEEAGETVVTYKVQQSGQKRKVSHVSASWTGNCCVTDASYFGHSIETGLDPKTCAYGVKFDDGFNDHRENALYVVRFAGNVVIKDRAGVVTIKGGYGQCTFDVPGPDCEQCTPRTATSPPQVAVTEFPTQSPTIKASQAPSVSASQSPSVTASQSPTVTASQTPSVKASQAPTITASQAPSIKASQIPSSSPTESGTISGVVLEDKDLDSEFDYDGPDMPQSNVTIVLELDGEIVGTTTTNESGEYFFDGLATGNYTIRQVDQSGFTTVNDTDGDPLDNAINVSLEPGETSTGNDFLDVQVSNVSGIVLEDINSDNVGEDPISGVPINLCNKDNPSDCISTFTDSAGMFSFDNVPPGEYCVIQTNIDDFIDVGDSIGSNGGDELEDGPVDDPNVVCIVVVGGVDIVDIEFVDERPSSQPSLAPSASPTVFGMISGTVFEDVDDLGEFSPGDVGMSGVAVRLRQGSNMFITTTDSNGDYSFSGVSGGAYTIEEQTPIGGFIDVKDTDGDANGKSTITVVLPSGGTSENNNFLEAKVTMVGGNVLEDLDNNDSGDSGIPGVNVTLCDTAVPPTCVTSTTDTNGYFGFVDVPPGEYCLVEENLDGFIDVGDSIPGGDEGEAPGVDDPNTICFNVTGGVDIPDVEFVDERPSLAPSISTSGAPSQSPSSSPTVSGSISGQVFEDITNGGVFDDSNRPIRGVAIGLYKDGKPFQATTSDLRRGYSFTNLPPGNYTVMQMDLPGFVDVRDTDGGDPDRIMVILGAGQQSTENNFLEVRLTKIGGKVTEDIDNDNLGEDVISGVPISLCKKADATDCVMTLTDSGGSFVFDALPGFWCVIQTNIGDFVDVGDSIESNGGIEFEEGGLDDPNMVCLILVVGEDVLDIEFVDELLSGSPSTTPSASPTTAGVISGAVYEDIDALGLFSPGDVGLSGVEIRLLLNGTVVATTVTDSNGQYSLAGLEAGSYTIQEESPLLGFVDVSDKDGPANGNNTIAVDLAPGSISRNNKFLEARKPIIAGIVLEDTDSDNVGEEPISGAPINLCFKMDPADCIQTSTDSSGVFEFSSVDPGEYCVIQTNIGDFIDVGDSIGNSNGGDELEDGAVDDPNVVCIVARPAMNILDIEFVDELPSAEPSASPSSPPTQSGSISGFVLEDADGDGDFSSGDVGMAGVRLQVVRNGQTQGTATTNGKGAYSFSGLAAGSYVVRQETPLLGFTDLKDTDGDSNGASNIAVVLTAGGSSEDNNFLESRSDTRRRLRRSLVTSR